MSHPTPDPPPRAGAGAFLGLLLALAPACSGPTPAPEPRPAELVLRGGRIVTLDPGRPEARAIALGGGRILALGDGAQLEAWIGPGTEIVELEGRLVVPGFVEGHGHFLGLGDFALQLDLRAAADFDEVVEQVARAARAAPPGELIRGRGWHQEKWSAPPAPNVEGLPLHAALSARTPDHPVILTHASGHATFVNARALELAGIGRDTPDPPGGTILRDAQGEPTGALRESASALLAPVHAAARPPRVRRLAELAAAECLRKGVTSFQDAGISFADLAVLRAMAEEGSLGVRIYAMLREPNAALRRHMLESRAVGLGDQFLTVRAVKRSLDGALGSHGAWLLEPYADLPESAGLETYPLEDLRETAELCMHAGYQLCVHAIGDRANREALDVYERAFRSHPHVADPRWRIEHAQHLDRADIPRFAALGVIASMQAIHCTSDAPWVVPRLGEARASAGAYRWRDLVDSGARVTNGTDAPVEDLCPLANFQAAVTRRTAAGWSFFPDQVLTRAEALHAATLGPAWAAFEEHQKGSLEVGKLADLVVLTHDILDCPEAELLEARVDLTVLAGRIRYRRGAPDPLR